MKEGKDEPGKVSTCFDESPCAEMMQKLMGEQGIGSLLRRDDEIAAKGVSRRQRGALGSREG